MQKLTAEQIIKRINKLPSLPAAVQRLCKLTADTETSYDEISEVISRDEALTSRLLRVANSSFYGLSQKVGTVSEAVVVLGIDAIKSLAIGVSVFGFSAGKGASQGLSREDLWRHGTAVGSAARLLEAQLQLSHWEEAFVGGMLHDLGKIVLMECFPEHFTPVLDGVVADGKPIQVVEQETFGIDHATLGAEMCRHWQMPAALIEMVAQHHAPHYARKPVSPDDHLVHAVRLGDNLARLARIGSDGDPHIAADFLKIAELEAISTVQLRQFLLQLPAEVRRVEVFFELVNGRPEAAPADGPSPRVMLHVRDPGEAELIRMSLLTAGISVVREADAAAPLQCVVTDDPQAPEVLKAVRGCGAQLLDLAGWKRAVPSSAASAPLNIERLHAWLTKELRKS